MIAPLAPEALILETDRLRLTPMTMDDTDIATTLLTDARVMKYVTEEPETAESVLDHMPDAIRRGAGGRLGIGTVSRKDTGEKLGDAILLPVPIETDDTEWETVVPERWPDAQIEVGYLLRPDQWGQGFATEACKCLIDFLFANSGLDEIVATTDPENTRSHNVLQKNGLRPVGIQRAYAWDNVLWFEITRAEWIDRTG